MSCHWMHDRLFGFQRSFHGRSGWCRSSNLCPSATLYGRRSRSATITESSNRWLHNADYRNNYPYEWNCFLVYGSEW
jgi:hypothetical protein